jgi:diguanylate cyclase (GGDEF)-like protein/PAS domain S-box-containing protein
MNSDDYLASAFEAAPIGMALLDLDAASIGRVLRANPALCELTGYSLQQLEAGGIDVVLHPDERDAVLSALAKLAAGELTGFRTEQRLVHARRHTVWVIVSAAVVREGLGSARCIWQMLDIEERKRFEGELGYLADHDPLTGLLNRRGFVRELENQIAHARRYGGGGAALFLDIDDFKYVNDTLGHSVGDEVIGNVARIVEHRVRETDVCARLGGDEFGVLLPHANANDAEILSASLLQAVRDHDALALGSGRGVTVSVGVTVFFDPAKDLTADDILIDSDLAMYAAKGAGKNRFAVASPANQKWIRARVTWADRVRRALREDLFELYCQPVVALDGDTAVQWELLLRLPGEGGEMILPAQFLYTAERSGLILAIDRWVISEAIRLIALHRAAGRELTLEVNVSGRSVADPELPAFIEMQLEAAGIDPARLVLEVTEAATIANMHDAGKFATRVNDLGCRFALDDFGAGFGSFYYLKHIPFDYVKIDGEFIRDLPASTTDQLILDSIVQMSRGLGKRTIAEFVADRETVNILKEKGVDYGQGYHLGRPRPLAEGLAG